MASTYPLEVVQADRWLKANPKVTGAALDEALKKQSWDDSVKSLCRTPDVIDRMSKNLDWTSDLGDAFLDQQQAVLDAVQRMRKKAENAGNLKTTPQQKVIVEKESHQDRPGRSAGDLRADVQRACRLRVGVVVPELPTTRRCTPTRRAMTLAASALSFGVGMAVGAAVWGTATGTAAAVIGAAAGAGTTTSTSTSTATSKATHDQPQQHQQREPRQRQSGNGSTTPSIARASATATRT